MNKEEIKRDCSFNIRVLDNFFSQTEFEEINKLITQQKYGALETIQKEYPTNHIWFSSLCDDKLKNLIKDTVTEKFKVKVINIPLCSYTLLSKVPPENYQIHDDYETDWRNWQSIIFIKGDPALNSGIGFYNKDEKNKFNLTTHIGFYPNRMVFWKCNIWHAPLNFLDEFKTRYSIITQYKLEV